MSSISVYQVYVLDKCSNEKSTVHFRALHWFSCSILILAKNSSWNLDSYFYPLNYGSLYSRFWISSSLWKKFHSGVFKYEIAIIISILLICTIKRHISTFPKLWCAYKTELLNASVFLNHTCYRNLLRLSLAKTCVCLEQWFMCSCSLSPGSIVAICWNIPIHDLRGWLQNQFLCVCVSSTLLIVFCFDLRFSC